MDVQILGAANEVGRSGFLVNCNGTKLLLDYGVMFEKSDDRWTTVASPVYGEKDVLIRYLCLDLLWRQLEYNESQPRKASTYLFLGLE